MTTWIAISSDDYGATTRVVATGDTLESAWQAMYDRFDEIGVVHDDPNWPDEWSLIGDSPFDTDTGKGVWCYEERSGWNGWILPLITDAERERTQ